MLYHALASLHWSNDELTQANVQLVLAWQCHIPCCHISLGPPFWTHHNPDPSPEPSH